MIRRLHKGWSDQKPFRRRVRWYEGVLGDPGPNASSDQSLMQIRLQFDEIVNGERGTYHAYYEDRVEAQSDWDEFVAWAKNAPPGEPLAASFGEKLEAGARFAYRSKMAGLEKRIVRS